VEEKTSKGQEKEELDGYVTFQRFHFHYGLKPILLQIW